MSQTTHPIPVPVTDDYDTGGHFDAAARGELAICVCSNCDTVLHLPRAYCFACGSMQVGWRVVSGKARLYTWTTTEREITTAFPAPNTVVMVDLEDAPGVHLIGNLRGRPELSDGMPMRVRFDTLPDGTIVPEWEIDDRA